MDHILRDGTIDFDAYRRYLDTIRNRLPAHVAAFASDERHFSLDARESLHDAWLMELAVREPTEGVRREHRATDIEVRLLGPFHDRVHVLAYKGVKRYELIGSKVVGGHGDLYTHEVRLGSDGIIHELLFNTAEGSAASRLLFECEDFTHEMIPRSQIIA